jgi:hypothetical protein
MLLSEKPVTAFPRRDDYFLSQDGRKDAVGASTRQVSLQLEKIIYHENRKMPLLRITKSLIRPTKMEQNA